MKIFRQKIEFQTNTQMEFVDVTDRVQAVIEASGVREGQVLVFAAHTTLGVAVNQNESMLIQDFMRVLYKLAPVDEHYSHDLFELRKETVSDGRSNGHSHCKALALGVSAVIPIERGKLALSQRQSVFAVEFDGGRKRDINVQVMGL
jgi:secondary thiamine-phosphate synthase enzyme